MDLITNIIVVLSLIIQVLCSVYIIRLLKFSRAKKPWIIIFSAFVLMAFRRLVSMLSIFVFNITSESNLYYELSGFIISFLMFIAIIYFIPVLKKMQKTDIDLHKSESRYRLLFSEMLDAFALHEIVLNEEKIPVDYIFLEINPAFEKMLGVKKEDIINKKILDVFPETEKFWIDTYGKVATTGKPAHFQHYSQQFDKHFEVKAFSPLQNCFAVIFQDITKQKMYETKLINSYQEIEIINKELTDTSNQLLELNKTLENRITEEIKNRIDDRKKILQHSRVSVIKDMTDNLFHYWRQPLCVLSLGINLIRRKIVVPNSEEKIISDLFEKTIKEITDMSDSVDFFKEFFTIQKNKVSFNLYESIFNTLRVISAQLHNYSIKVYLCCNKDECCEISKFNIVHDYLHVCSSCNKDIIKDINLYGRRDIFNQLILNVFLSVIDNLIAEKDNETDVQVKTIIIRIFSEEGYNNISVISKNYYINDETIKEIFEPDLLKSDIEETSNFGLYLSKSMIEEHFIGNFKIKNIEEGTQYLIEIPVE